MRHKDTQQQSRGAKPDESWKKLLNPETLKGNLICASLYLTAFEILKNSVVEQLKAYILFGLDESTPAHRAEYEKEVLARNRSPFHASVSWLQDNGVIDAADVQKIDSIRKHRNSLAHELLKFIASADTNIDVSKLQEICEIVTKIDRRWIQAVEVPANPVYDGQEITDNAVTSGNMLFLDMII